MRKSSYSAELADPAAEVERLRALIYELDEVNYFYGVSEEMDP
jgi:hypothetical protein